MIVDGAARTGLGVLWRPSDSKISGPDALVARYREEKE